MPRGIPNDPNGGSKGGYHAVTKDDLKARIKEIEQRIKQMDRREKAIGDLKNWLANRKLDYTDLQWMLRKMKPVRSDAPVKSRKPLQPQKGKPPGYFMFEGKLVAPKGDPEFRRRILDARKEKNWNTIDVGKKLGVSGSTVSSWEVGRYVPREQMRAKIVKLFDLPEKLGAAASAAMEASFGGHSRNGAASQAD